MPTRRAVATLLAGLPLASPAKAAGPTQADLLAASRLVGQEGRYWPLYDLAQRVDAPELRQVKQQVSAFWGDEQTALAGARSTRALDLEGHSAEDAVAAIRDAARDRRVVMINEAHVASRHRLFVAQVLRALRPLGFTHYAAETFAHEARVDALRAGAPLPANIGWYTLDPVFAEAAREALGLGYRLAAYEWSGEAPKDMPRAAQMSLREDEQVANLTTLLTDPDARIVVHVGHGHLSKLPDTTGQIWAAARLKQKTGIDPLCVTQDRPGAFGPHAPDSPLVDAVLARFRPLSPIMLRGPDGVLVGDLSHGSEMMVFHPSLPDVEGRPGWLAADARRRRVTLALPKDVEGPVIAQAFHAEDPDPALPADHYVVAAGTRRLTFFLSRGRYRIRLETAQGSRLLRTVSV